MQLAAGMFLACNGYSVLAADQLAGEPEATEFSGNVGAELVLRKPAAENDAIFGIETAEHHEDPCYLRIRYRDVTTGEERSSKIFAECDDNNNNRGRDASRKRVVLPADMMVTGASICLNSRRDKLKGIELRTTFRECVRGDATAAIPVDQCGSIFRHGSMEHRLCSGGHRAYQQLNCNSSMSVVKRYMERPNCKGTNRGPDNDWEKVVQCPPRTVATGFRLSTRNSGGERVLIDGLALECTRVESGSKQEDTAGGTPNSTLTWSD